jgi:hypothetical protein
MAGAFPGAVTNYTNPTSANYHDVPVGGRTQSQFLSDHSDDIEALATKLGISLAAPADTPVADRLLGSNASGKSGWMQLLAGMVPNSLITAAMLADTAAPKKLGEVILGASAASISFQSIPATYRSLMIQFSLRTDAGSSTSLMVRFNNDSGTNQYTYSVVYGAGSSPGAFSALNDTSLYTAELPRLASTANQFTQGISHIYDYAATNKHKGILSIANRPESEIYIHGGTWRSTAAINRVDLIPTGGQLVSGSSATLWGMPA